MHTLHHLERVGCYGEPPVGSIHGSEASGHQENTDMITVSDTRIPTCELQGAHTPESQSIHT